MSCRELDHWFGTPFVSHAEICRMVNAQPWRFVPSRLAADVIFCGGRGRDGADVFSRASVSWPGEIVDPAGLRGERPALLQGLLDQSPRGVVRWPGGYRPRGERAAWGDHGAGQWQDRA